MASTSPVADGAPPPDIHTWRPLRVLCTYRVALAAILLAGFVLTRGTDLMEVAQPELFLRTVLVYLALAAAALLMAVSRQPGFALQVHGQIPIDIIAIALLIHASQSNEMGLEILMLVAVAGGSLLTGARLGAFFAAVATVALLAERILAQLKGTANEADYTRVAMIGTATFVTALVGALLARRARENEALAERRGVDVANLEALNAHIVQRIQTGVVALDPEGRVRLANRTARELLGELRAPERPALAEVAPALAEAHRRWRTEGEPEESPLPTPAGGAEYVPRFRPLGEGAHGGTLIFLDNLTEMRAQVQEAKLASLGRLTASIAHEIRNPLAAMLNAAQLLDESDHLEKGDRRLVEIIGKQGRRLNKTVENVLQLSRRTRPELVSLRLDDWLPRFAADWRDQQGPQLARVGLHVDTQAIRVWFDEDNLRQVLDNLVRNAVEHAGGDGRAPEVALRARRDRNGHSVLEVEDNGPGIDPALRDRLFEPFATGSPTGTGLGLFLAREICEANQARIRLDDGVTAGACFQIVFMAPPRGDG